MSLLSQIIIYARRQNDRCCCHSTVPSKLINNKIIRFANKLTLKYITNSKTAYSVHGFVHPITHTHARTQLLFFSKLSKEFCFFFLLLLLLRLYRHRFYIRLWNSVSFRDIHYIYTYTVLYIYHFPSSSNIKTAVVTKQKNKEFLLNWSWSSSMEFL